MTLHPYYSWAKNVVGDAAGVEVRPILPGEIDAGNYQPRPEDIKLHEPFNNRECLHCHQGARSFEEGATHNADPATLPGIKANTLSCVSSGCHDVVHNVGQLEKVKLWKEVMPNSDQ